MASPQSSGTATSSESRAVHPASLPASRLSVDERAQPWNIRFTHDCIADVFRPVGRQQPQKLDEVIDAIQRGELSPDDFPPLTVVPYQGRLHSLSNRRLFVFRVLQMQGVISSVKIRLYEMSDPVIQQSKFDATLCREASKWDRSYTTQSDGRVVHVRGSGSQYTHKQWPHASQYSMDTMVSSVAHKLKVATANKATVKFLTDTVNALQVNLTIAECESLQKLVRASIKQRQEKEMEELMKKNEEEDRKAKAEKEKTLGKQEIDDDEFFAHMM